METQSAEAPQAQPGKRPATGSREAGRPHEKRPGRAGPARAWMIAALAGAVLLRAAAWLLLRKAPFTGIPGFEDEIHAQRIVGLLQGAFPEVVLPAGSPTYPYVGALLGSLTGGSIPGILLLQCLAGVGVVGLIAWAFAPLLSPRGRWLAALLYAINPIAIFLELRLQPFVFALLLALPALRWLFFDDALRSSRAGWGGLLLGLGFLLRPLLFFLIAVAAAIRLLRRSSPAESRPRAAVIPALLLIAGFLILPVLFSAYHATRPGGEAGWNWSDAYSFWRTLQPGTWGTARSAEIPVWEGYDVAHTRANEAAGRRLSQGDVLVFYRGRGLQTLVEGPVRWIGLVLVRAVMLLSYPEVPDPTSAAFTLGRSAKPLLWGLYIYPLYLALAGLGFWLWRRERALRLLAPPLAALAAVNLLGTYSLASRMFWVAGMLPATALALEGLPGIARGLRRNREVRAGIALALGLVLFAFLDLPGARGRFEDPSEDLRETARVLKTRGDAGEATTLLRQALRRNPANPSAHVDLGELLIAQGLTDAARAEFATALETDPEHERALFGMAEVDRAAGNYVVAESLMVKLTTAHPRHPLYLNQLATIYLMQGEFAQARGLLQRALEIAPDYQVAQANLRAADEAQRRASTQVLPEELSAAMDPELVRLGAEAIQATMSQRMPQADSLTQAAMARWPENPMAWYMRGAFLLRAGRAAEAVDPLLRLCRAFPGRGITTTMGVQALLAVGRRDEALALARQAMTQAPDEMNRRTIENLLTSLGVR
jgi:tetratricopeptide (TPR) repeat protein